MPSLANRKVLVLNRGWTPIAVVTAERAICLLMGTVKGSNEPKARIIDPANDFRTFTWEDWELLKPHGDEARIRGSRQDYRIPEVILLSRYNKLPQQRVHFSRRTIYRRDGNQCQYCGKKPGTELLNIDHVIPRSQGGQTTWDNCVLACIDCNTKKADRTPEQARMTLIRKPFKPKFTLFRGEYRCKSWEQFLGEAYWETELVNDNK